MYFRKIFLAALIILIAASAANADRRKFVWTYQPILQQPDGVDLEFYQTTKLSTKDSWEYRLEIEHGLAPNWDMSIYQIFSQNENEALKWDAFQLRTRFRFSSTGSQKFAPVFYLEYKRKIDLKAQNKLETKLIFGRDFDKISIALNPVYEFFWAPGEPRHEYGLDIGLGYELSYKWSIGVESTSRYEIIKNAENETASYLGPTCSFASGPVWYSFGYAWGITDDSDDARARFLMGIGL